MTKKSTEKIGPLTIREDIRKNKSTGFWILDIPPHFDGNPKRKRHRFSSKTACKNAARKHVQDLNFADQLTNDGHVGFLLNDIFHHWEEAQLKKIKIGRKKLLSYEKERSALANVLDVIGQEDIGVIDADMVENYQLKRKNDGVKAVTINTETRRLKAVISWCYDKKLVDRPLKFDPLPEPKVHTEVPNIDEVVKILEELDFDKRVLTRLMIETGLRVSEAYELRWDQIDMEHDRISIGLMEEMTPKTQGSVRGAYIGQGLKADLIKLRQERETVSDYVFPNKNDPDRPMDNYRKSLKSAVKRSGVRRFGKPMRFTPKYGRKAFSSYQWIKGTPLELIKKKMGHSEKSRVTETNYLFLPDETMKTNIVELDL